MYKNAYAWKVFFLQEYLVTVFLQDHYVTVSSRVLCDCFWINTYSVDTDHVPAKPLNSSGLRAKYAQFSGPKVQLQTKYVC